MAYVYQADERSGRISWRDTNKAGKLIADDLTAWAKEHLPNGGASAAVAELT